MPMKNPPHPGRSIRNACLDALGLSVTEGAKVLGVSRQTLNNVIHGKSGISPEMAIRLSKAFGSTPGNLVTDAACLRSRAGPQGREQDQSPPPAHAPGAPRAMRTFVGPHMSAVIASSRMNWEPSNTEYRSQLRRKVEKEIDNYVYEIPADAIGNPITDDAVRDQLVQLRASLVDPYWDEVEVRDTFVQVGMNSRSSLAEVCSDCR